MEERRFDALTRQLGAATSRRQLLKGVLGGVLAAVVGRAVEPKMAEAAEVCNRQLCKRKAWDALGQCEQICHKTFGRRGFRRLEAISCLESCAVGFSLQVHDCEHSATGCLGHQTCCGSGGCANLEADPNNCGACDHHCDYGQECVSGQCTCATGQIFCDDACVDTDTDPNNCGACGHTCGSDIACDDGQCQCLVTQTLCDNTCVDTQTDNDNCGTCGHACGDCEQCEAGICQPLGCTTDQVCCQHHCVANCENHPIDPQTCQCPFCDTLENETQCGPTSICCSHACVDTTCPEDREFSSDTCQCECTPVECPTGKSQDPTTCQCVCTPITCPNGESQDPDTCQCVDKCNTVTCGTCQTCNPTSGTCVNADNSTDCGGGNVCCDGVCQSDCVCSTLTCQNDCCPSDDYYCCEALDGCCPPVTLSNGASGAFCLAPGPGTITGWDGITVGGCCQPEDLMKLSGIDEVTGECSCDDPGNAYQIFCAGNMPTDLVGLPTCSCGPWLT